MGKKKFKCLKLNCDYAPFRGGLCELHYAEDEAKRKERDDAVRFLRDGEVDGARPTDQELMEESSRLYERWRRVCDAVNFQYFTRELPKDEAQYAVEWCIEIAKQIIEA